MRVDPWRAQSAVTSIEPFQAVFDELPDDLRGLRGVSQQLVAHYMIDGDEPGGRVTGERLAEVDTRYADAMVARLLALGQPSLARERPTAERIVGCCRDFALLFVAMARHKGFPARIRV
ncbi:MAG TPA: transglutaminase domain-containing protein, partial [Thermomicrobiaceae bacterium]|nr:transglutaminase domain-containing protein [Thermomicrobiaceae bacterium]